jgi:hypothetical protein
MSEGKKEKEFRVEAAGSRERRGSLRDLVDGSLLIREAVVKQLPFFLFISFLILIFIGNRYHAERVVRQTDILQKELKELRSEAISVASEFNRINKQSEVVKLIEEQGLDLVETTDPPTVIERAK